MRKKVRQGTGVILVLLILTATTDFLLWHTQQIKRLKANSTLTQTASGIIEYTMVGNGPAVLVLHGTLGGYDQTEIMASILDTSANTFIFVSRPGYLRTPLATGATFTEQAEAYVALLDELGIDQVAVVATSGGGPSALQFALHYPERCWGLVLLAANADARVGDTNESRMTEPREPSAFLINILLSDMTSWLTLRASQIMPRQVLALTVGEENVTEVMNDEDKRASFTELINSIALLSQRREGTLNDGKQFLTFTDHPFENITTPTLILYGTEDNFVSSSEQVYLAETLPNSEYIEIEGGTHFMLISHADIIIPLISDFLKTHAQLK